MRVKPVRWMGLSALLASIYVLAASSAGAATRTLPSKSGSGFGQDNSTATWLMSAQTTQSNGITINEMKLCPTNDVSGGVCSSLTLEFYIQILFAPDDATVTFSGLTGFDGSTYGIVHCATNSPPQDTLPLCTATPPASLVVDATVPVDNSSLTLVFGPTISSPTSNFFPSGGLTFFIDESEDSSPPPFPTVTVTGHAGAALTPASLTFGSQSVGTTSALQGVILTNGGLSPLTITGILPSGNFTESDNCRHLSPIAAGASCSIFVSFTPTVAGARSGAITIADSAPSGTQVISLSGTGDASAITMSPPTVAFGTQGITSSSNSPSPSTLQTVTVTNTSATNSDTITAVSVSADSFGFGDFNVEATSTCTNFTAVSSSTPFSGTVNLSTVSGGTNTCNLDIDALPSLLGPVLATVTITDSFGTHQIALSTVGGTPEIYILIPSLSFINPPLLYSTPQLVGTSSSPLEVELSNARSIKFNSVLSGAGLSSGSSSIPCIAGNVLNCRLGAEFSPTTRGDQIGSIIVADNMSTGMEVITSTGTATGPGVKLTPNVLGFPAQAVGTISGAQTFNLLNNGTTPLTISSVASGTADFTVQSNPCPLSPSTLASNSSCTIGVTFNPQASGARKGWIAITDDASDSPQVVVLTGVAAAASLTPPGLSFPGQTVGVASTPLQITLKNNGGATINIWQTAILGANAPDFSIATNTCGSTLGALSSCTLSVIFTPSSPGARSASFLVSNDGGGSPQSVLLSGTGLAGPSSGLSAMSLSFGNQDLKTSSAPQSVVFTNTGKTPFAIQRIEIDGSGHPDFQLTHTCGAILAAGQSCTLKIIFAPLIKGTLKAAVNIVNNSRGGLRQVRLTGVGVQP